MTKIRGDYGIINASFWDDPDVQKELTPEARLVFACLRTCQAYGIAGIFRYYPATLRQQTGLIEERGWTDQKLEYLFAELERAGFIEHDIERSVIWIIEGLRWDPSVSLAHARQRIGIYAQLAALPRTRLLARFVAHYGLKDLPPELDARIRQYHTESDKEKQESLSVNYPVGDFSGRKTPLTLISSDLTLTLKRRRAAPAPPAPASPQNLDREAARAQRREVLVRQLTERINFELGAETASILPHYLAQAERGLESYFERRGGRWTPTRAVNLLERLSKVSDIRSALGALEVYVDKNAGDKDHDYLAGIARRMDRTLKRRPDEFDRDLAKHRQKYHDGLYSELAAPPAEGSVGA